MRCGGASLEDSGLTHYGTMRKDKGRKSAGDRTGC